MDGWMRNSAQSLAGSMVRAEVSMPMEALKLPPIVRLTSHKCTRRLGLVLDSAPLSAPTWLRQPHPPSQNQGRDKCHATSDAIRWRRATFAVESHDLLLLLQSFLLLLLSKTRHRLAIAFHSVWRQTFGLRFGRVVVSGWRWPSESRNRHSGLASCLD
jgi:hypothetical protein